MAENIPCRTTIIFHFLRRDSTSVVCDNDGSFNYLPLLTMTGSIIQDRKSI